jgi:hypothetical protein
MKTLVQLIIFALLAPSICAQVPLNAEDSDPVKMGWMQGFPPPEKQNSICFGWQFLPVPRTAIQRMPYA